MWRFLLRHLEATSGASGARKQKFDRIITLLPFIFIYGITISISFCLTADLQAQSSVMLGGRVFDDDDGGAVFMAEVELLGTDYKTQTDNFGNFNFEYIPPGDYILKIRATGFHNFNFEYIPPGDYILKIRATGFQSFQSQSISIVTDITRHVQINLKKKIYLVEGIKVTLLQTVEGVYVQRTGTNNGQAQVSIRGSAPRHVLVLVDGQKINPSSNSIADLNTIPLDMVERVEIYKGGASTVFGPDAIAGAVNIITQPEKKIGGYSIKTEERLGKWNSQYLSLSLSDLIPSDKWATRLAVSRNQSDGDFSFSYTSSPENMTYKGTRINLKT